MLALAIALRVALWWVNPPDNALDDHLQPIHMAMKTGTLPAKDACFQCYQPPVFYWGSAKLGTLALRRGLAPEHLDKFLQFIACGAGILTLAVCWLILRRLPLSPWARLCGFAVVCFLPRHIYMCALHSNDTTAYFFVALSVWLILVALDKNLMHVLVLAAEAAITATLFVKHTTWGIAPAAGVSLWRDPRRRARIALVAWVLLPLAALGASMVHDALRYGSPLPSNFAIYDPSQDRPRDPEPISFLSFHPWTKLDDLVLTPGELHSYWTLVFTGAWFDTEPYFLDRVEPNEAWWDRYYAWYRGEGPFPGAPTWSPLVKLTGDGLILLGLVPLALAVVGFFVCVGTWRRQPTMGIFPVMLAVNVAVATALTLRLPVFNAMKPSYLLPATPALMVFLALGAMQCEKAAILRWLVVAALVAIAVLTTIHVGQIVLAFAATS